MREIFGVTYFEEIVPDIPRSLRLGKFPPSPGSRHPVSLPEMSMLPISHVSFLRRMYTNVVIVATSRSTEKINNKE